MERIKVLVGIREQQISTWWSLKWYHVNRRRKDSGLICNRAVLQTIVMFRLATDEMHTETYLLVEKQNNYLKKENYCTNIPRSCGYNWARVWNCIRHESLMGWPRKNALNGEGGPKVGHNPLTRIIYNWRSINVWYLNPSLLNKMTGSEKWGEWLRGRHWNTLTDQLT